MWVYYGALHEGELVVLVHFNKTELEFWFAREHYIKTEFCTKPGGNGKGIRGRPKLRRCDELRGGHHMVWVQKLELMCSRDRSGAGSRRRSSSTQGCWDNGRRRRRRRRKRRRKRKKTKQKTRRRRGKGRRREAAAAIIVGALYHKLVNTVLCFWRWAKSSCETCRTEWKY